MFSYVSNIEKKLPNDSSADNIQDFILQILALLPYYTVFDRRPGRRVFGRALLLYAAFCLVDCRASTR